MSSGLGILLSAILGTLSFPFAYHSENLIPGWISAACTFFFLVPLLLATRNLSNRKSFKVGYVFGFLHGGFSLYWVTIALSKYGSLSISLSAFFVLLLLFVLSFYPAITLWFLSTHREKKHLWLVGAVTYTLLEWTRVYFPLEGFPWLSPAYGLYSFLSIIQILEWGGIPGLNFLVLFVNFAIAETLWRKQNLQAKPFAPFTLAALLLVLFSLLGHQRFVSWENRPQKKTPIRFALLQGNIGQEAKLDPMEAGNTIRIYEALMQEAIAKNPDLIVWPEAAMPFLMDRETTHFSLFYRYQTRAQSVIGAATRSQKPDQENTEYFNSAFVVDPKGKVQSRYDKTHLVPFGEYVPLSKILPIRNYIPVIAGVFEKGSLNQELPKLKEISYSIMICYEILFPALWVEATKKGAGFFVNITNDAWFDQTSGPYQHENFAIFRAIEFRKPILRAANTGISLWVDELGRRWGRTDFFTKGIVFGEIHPNTFQTFYARFPLLIPILLTLFLALFLFPRKEPSP